MLLYPNDNEYDFDEYYGTTLAEDRKALVEDLGHLFFIGTGILMCAISNWRAAALGAVGTIVVRDMYRTCARLGRKVKK